MRQNGGWLAFFERANGEQDAPLLRKQAERYVANLLAAIPIDRATRVLEFGCGGGFVTSALAPRAGTVLFWDAAPAQQQRARTRLAALPNTRFVDLQRADRRGLAQAADLILVNSVVQYMGEPELLAWLPRWREMLAPGGAIVISDLLPPDHRDRDDTIALIRFGVRQRCVVAALRSVVRAGRSYTHTKRRYPLYHVGPAWLTAASSAAGLTVRFLPRNLTHFPRRFSVVLSVATG